MEFRAARPSEREQVLDLLARWYNDRDFFARYNVNDPAFRDELCLVAADNGRLVATAQIFDRLINLNGESVRLGGIGSVFTDESYRGRGIVSALMELAVATMRGEKFDLSMLFAQRTDFYARFGWRPASRLFSAIANAEKIACPIDFELTCFDATSDLATLEAIHRSYSGRFNLTVIRDTHHWRANLRFAGNPDEHFVVCRRNAEIEAYTRAIWFHGVPMVMEFGYADDCDEAILALFRHLGEVAADVPSSFSGDSTAGRGALIRNFGPPVSLLVTHSAHDTVLEQRLTARGAKLFHHEDRLIMWLVIRSDRLAEVLGISPDAVIESVHQLASDPSSLYWTSDRF
jgi:predicted N-acetyltransferase YhbS